jgi:hypothetical protein
MTPEKFWEDVNKATPGYEKSTKICAADDRPKRLKMPRDISNI